MQRGQTIHQDAGCLVTQKSIRRKSKFLTKHELVIQHIRQHRGVVFNPVIWYKPVGNREPYCLVIEYQCSEDDFNYQALKQMSEEQKRILYNLSLPLYVVNTKTRTIADLCGNPPSSYQFLYEWLASKKNSHDYVNDKTDISCVDFDYCWFKDNHIVGLEVTCFDKTIYGWTTEAAMITTMERLVRYRTRNKPKSHQFYILAETAELLGMQMWFAALISENLNSNEIVPSSAGYLMDLDMEVANSIYVENEVPHGYFHHLRVLLNVVLA